jgi:hypothetical protein
MERGGGEDRTPINTDKIKSIDANHVLGLRELEWVN